MEVNEGILTFSLIYLMFYHQEGMTNFLAFELLHKANLLNFIYGICVLDSYI